MNTCGYRCNDGYRQCSVITLLIASFLLLFSVDKVCAQYYSWSDFMEYVQAGQDDEKRNIEEGMEELIELHEHPVNLNMASEEDLTKIPFLTQAQIEDILAYVYRYGPMKTISELMFVKSVGYEERMILPLFFYVADPPVEKKPFKLKNLLKYAKNELITTLNVPLYQLDGYKEYEREILLKSPNKKYLGNALYHNIRYRYTYGNKVYAGFTAEKDAGEPFGSYGNWSYDAFSFHALLKTDGILKTLALGDYKLSFGQGVVFGMGALFTKNICTSVSASNQGIKRFFSTSEVPHFRGAAATLRINKGELTLFVSQTRNDATLNKDGTVATWRKDGYHRTLGEMERKHNLLSRTLGGNILWNYARGYVGATGYYQHFNRSFEPGNAFYRMYYPTGKTFGVLGTYYSFHSYRFAMFGETGYSSDRKGVAAVHILTYRFGSHYRIKCLHRYYSPRYHSFYSGSFAENSSATNENGLYIGVEAIPVNYIQLEAYADVFRFKWPRYGLSHSSGGYEGMFRLSGRFSQTASAVFSYRVKRKEKFDVYRTYHQLKIQGEFTPIEKITLKTAIAYNHTSSVEAPSGDGWLVSQKVAYQTGEDRLQCSLYAAYFHCNDYESRLYDYEPLLMYTYAFPAYYGEGIRLSLTGRWKIGAGWTFLYKYSLTNYFDRNSIGSGTQRLNHSSKNDLNFQLRYTF